MDDFKRLISSPAAIRRDYKGFIVLAVPDDDRRSFQGYCWRIIDWHSFGGSFSSENKEDVFTYFNEKIDGFIRFRDSLKALK